MKESVYFMKLRKGDIHFFLTSEESPAKEAVKAFHRYTARYGQAAVSAAKIFCGIGGDGTMIRGLHDYWSYGKPFFGLNYGCAGFLMNEPNEQTDLLKRIGRAGPLTLSQLRIDVVTSSSDVRSGFAINEFLICNRNRSRTVKLNVKIGGIERLECLSADGLLVATPVGSTGYNASAGGPVVLLRDDIMLLTPLNPYQPRGFKSLIIEPDVVEIKVIQAEQRPADVYNDLGEVAKDAALIRIQQDRSRRYTLLHDPEMPLQEKNIRLQLGQSLKR